MPNSTSPESPGAVIAASYRDLPQSEDDDELAMANAIALTEDDDELS